MGVSKKFYYENDSFSLIYDDTFNALNSFENSTFDMIFADPPYFLSNDGITCSGGKMVSVNKGDWDKKIGIEEKHQFNREWIRLCYGLLKDEGTIWISGTLHNIYSIGMALEQEGFKIINNITWRKLNPPPNISCRYFVHSTETILLVILFLTAKLQKYSGNSAIRKQKSSHNMMQIKSRMNLPL